MKRNAFYYTESKKPDGVKIFHTLYAYSIEERAVHLNIVSIRETGDVYSRRCRNDKTQEG